MLPLFDITRFISRLDHTHATGIDRLEHALIEDSLNRFPIAYYIAKCGRSYALLNKKELNTLLDYKRGKPWPKASITDRLRLSIAPIKRQHRTALEQCATVFGPAKHVLSWLTPHNFFYVNVGHSNLSDVFFSHLADQGCVKNIIFIHDVIPLDFPQYCRPDSISFFKKKFTATIHNADLIFYNSKYTQNRALNYIPPNIKQPLSHVLYLASSLQNKIRSSIVPIKRKATFLCIGTLEPRKNISVLLDVWENMHTIMPFEQIPNLILIGNRGWENDDFFNRLDGMKRKYSTLIEINNCSDEDMIAHMQYARALLFPSHVEGFGLPVQEALDYNLPVVAQKLDVLIELFCNRIDYIDNNTIVAWQEKIKKYTLNSNQKKIIPPPITLNNWDVFFNSFYLQFAKLDIDIKDDNKKPSHQIQTAP